jgi:hypothetical protein
LRENVGGVTTSNNEGVWSSGGGSLTFVAREGNTATGVTPTANFSTMLYPTLSESGQAGFRGTLPAASVPNDIGLWSQQGGVLGLVAIAGQQAPGTATGVVFHRSQIPAPSINSAGQNAFDASLTGPGVTAANDRGVWVQRNGALALVAREGSPAPTPTLGTTYGTLGAEAALNSAGQVAYSSTLVGGGAGAPTAGIWIDTNGVSSLVVASGTSAPGLPGQVFAGFDAVALNALGHLAFNGDVASPLSDGIWAGPPDQLRLVVREGAAAVGAAGASFGAPATFSRVLNNAGQVAFSGVVTGGSVNAANDRGIWAEGLDGQLKLIAREGDPLQISAGVSKTIAELQFAGGGGAIPYAFSNEQGRPSGFNDRGEVAFLATFTDGTSGVFVSSIDDLSAGDFNSDDQIDGADFLIWQQGVGRVGTGLPSNGDANGDGNVNAADLAIWRSKFGLTVGASGAAQAVPEPAGLLLLAAGAPVAAVSRFARRRRQIEQPSGG